MSHISCQKGAPVSVRDLNCVFDAQHEATNTKLFLSLAEHSNAINLPLPSIRNLISRGQYPIRTVLFGNRRLVPRVEHERLVATLLATGNVPFTGPETLDRIVPAAVVITSSEVVATPSPRRRGRPREAIPKSMGDVA
jgi:hypothetical protein